MTDRPHRYRLRRRPGDSRWALSVSPRGLVEHLNFGFTECTPWSQIRGVRWLRGGAAEISRLHGVPLRIPRGTPRLPELVAAIELAAAEHQTEWQEQGVPAAQVCAWLGIGEGELWRAQAGLSWLGYVAVAVCVGLLLIAAINLIRGDIGAVVGFLAYLAPCIPWLVWDLHNATGSSIEATGRHLTFGSAADGWTLAWHDLRAAQFGDRRATRNITLTTPDGEFTCHGPAARLGPLEHTIRRVVEANTARFEQSGRLVSDAALSPAELNSADAERGLSQTTN